MPAIQTDFQLNYEILEEFTPYVTAIVVAAGCSSRMGQNKQMISLRGIPVVARSLLAMEHSREIKDIVVVCRAQDMLSIQQLADQYHIHKITAIVEGGATRQQSVEAGIKACCAQTDYVAIHDGARPLVTGRVISDAVKGAMEHGAAAAGVLVKDTIKQVSQEGRVLGTPERSGLVCVQTPQVFKAALYQDALAKAADNHWHVTDDCALCERAGYDVYITPGDYANLKITTAEDIAVAESLLQSRGEDML